MSATKHTSGSWEAVRMPIHGMWLIQANATNIAGISVMGDGPGAEQAEANAHLIAAAPELLEALMAIMEFVDDHSIGEPRVSPALARTAIAKALGQEVKS